MAENKENVATSPERAQLKAHRKESDLNLNPQQLYTADRMVNYQKVRSSFRYLHNHYNYCCSHNYAALRNVPGQLWMILLSDLRERGNYYYCTLMYI